MNETKASSTLPQAQNKGKPARRIPTFVWILIVLLLVGFILVKLQKAQALLATRQASAPAAAAK